MGSLKLILQHEDIDNIKLPTHKEENLKISFRSEPQVGEDTMAVLYETGSAPVLPFAASEVHVAAVCGASVLCVPRETYKSVYQLSLDVKGSSISNNFNPGDTIGVIPTNKAEEVDFVLERANLYHQADVIYYSENVLSTRKSQIPKHVPVQSTLRYTLTHCLELRAVVKKLFLLALSKYTTDKGEKQILRLLCSKEGSEMYVEHILNKNISLLDILRSFPSCHPSAECLLSHLPRLLPRPYSVINSRLRDENIVSICFSLMELRDGRYGLTTEMLENIIAGRSDGVDGLEKELKNLTLDEKHKLSYKVNVKIYLRKNMGFSFPNETVNVLMICSGTGVAPYLGFLEERRLMKKNDPTLKLGGTWLFYGCRHPDVDYIYREELQSYLNEEILTRLSVTFSRIGDNVKYVQDAVRVNGERVAEFIDKGAYIFVCGDLSKMAKETEEALTQCVEKYTDRTDGEAVRFIKNLQNDKKYLLDIWC